MKTVTEIIGGAQALLPLNYDIQQCFEEHLSDEHKMFLHILRAAEAHLPEYVYPKKKWEDRRMNTQRTNGSSNHRCKCS